MNKIEDSDTKSNNDTAKQRLLCVGGYQRRSVLEVYNSTGVPKQIYPDIPTISSHHCVLKDCGILYCIGGAVCNNWTKATNKVYAMDLNAAELRWKEKAGMSERRRSFGAALFDHNLVVAGGSNGESTLNTVEIYEVGNNRWSNIVPMNHYRLGFALVVAGDKLFAIGGRNDRERLSNAEMLNDLKGSWEDVRSMTMPRADFAAVCFDSCIYAIGGTRKSKQSVEKYDPANDQWTCIRRMYTGRERHAACVLDGKIVVVGGLGNAGKRIEHYDPTVGYWTVHHDVKDHMRDHALVAV